MSTEDFYLRYYVGHKGKFGHEFLEFEFRPDGKLRYANNSNYKNDTMIRKEAFVHQAVMEELKRIILDSEIMAEDDSPWPPPDRVGRQVDYLSYTTDFSFVFNIVFFYLFVACRNWKLLLAMSTFLLPPPKLAPWWMSIVPKILRVCVAFTIWYRILNVWFFHSLVCILRLSLYNQCWRWRCVGRQQLC